MKVFWRYAGSTGEGNQFIVNFDKRKEISKTHEERAIKKIRALFEWAREERQIEKEIKKTTGKSIEEMLWGQS